MYINCHVTVEYRRLSVVLVTMFRKIEIFKLFSDGQFEQGDTNGPFVPYFFEQSILESRSSSRCFETFLVSHVDAVSAKSLSNVDSMAEMGRNSIEVGQI